LHPTAFKSVRTPDLISNFQMFSSANLRLPRNDHGPVFGHSHLVGVGKVRSWRATTTAIPRREPLDEFHNLRLVARVCGGLVEEEEDSGSSALA